MVYNGDVESDPGTESSRSNNQTQDESESEEEFLGRGTKRKSTRNERQTRRSKRNKYDEDESNHGSSRRSNRCKPDDFEKQSKTLCAKLNIKNIKIEYSEEDLKTLTTFKLYEEAIEPLIRRKNPNASDDSLQQLLDLKWRQFQRTNCADYQENNGTLEPAAAEEPVKKKRTNYKEVGSSDENLETDYEEDYVQEMKKKSKQKAKQANHDYCEECRNAGELIMCDACPRSYHHVCLDPELEETPEGKWLCPKCEAGEEPEEASDHDEYCEQCQDGGELLCCDTCPAAYHIYCLNPPLVTIPDGVWKCPECLAAPLPYKIQQILSWRWITTDQQSSTSSSKSSSNLREFFVKYEDKSYWECDWVTHIQLKLYQLGKYRSYVTRTDMDEVPEFELEDESRYPRLKSHNGVDLVKKYYQFGVKSNWLLVHRIISQKGDGNKPKEYLVKWRDLAYDQSTWEKADADIPGLSEAIKNFKENDKQQFPPKPLTSLKDKYDGQPGFLKGMGLQLHPYQIDGLNWLRHSWKKNTNTILADEMGLGKTIQTITFLYSLYVEGHCKGPFLIAVPLSTLLNWEREFELWAPNFYCLSYAGERTSRKMIQQCELYPGRKQRRFQVLLTTYEYISMDSYILNRYNWEVLVVDEAQRLKSNVTRFYQKLSEYKIAYRLLLTGTPLQNNLEELYHLLHFINDKKFYDIDSFTEEFADLSKENQVKRLHALLGPHMLRRLKADVLEMPSKSEFFIRIELSPMQKQYYKYILTKNFEALNPKGPGRKTSLINIMMDLKKCCNHPYLFTAAAEKAPISSRGIYETQPLIKASGKFVLLDKMLKKLRERGHRVLIFSQMTRLLDLLEEYLEGEDYLYERIDGSTNGVLRQEAIDRFNAPGAKQFVFLLSTRAGGLGINLATADTVIIYDSDWNPHNDTQAFSRCHRIGQKNKVMIYRFVARGSVEEQIARVAKRKMMLTHLVVRPGMGDTCKLSKDELDNIIKFGTEELFKEEGASEEIVYDDKAVEQLLDRSNEGIEEQKDTLASDYLSSFKVADYITKGEDSEPEEEDDDDDEAKKAKSEYWFKLLGEFREKEMVKKFGKGKRLRRKIDYTLSKDDNRNKPVMDTTYQYQSESSDTSEDDDFNIDTFNNPKTKQRKAPLPPLLRLTETNFEVYGFNARQRKAYLSSIMRFGAPPPNAYMSQWLTRDLQNKPESVFNAYTTLFMKHLCEKDSDQIDKFLDGVPKEGLSRQHVLTRIGVMSLIRRKVREYEPMNGYYSMPREVKMKKARATKKINSANTIDLTADDSRHSETANTIDLTNTEESELKPNEDTIKVELNTTVNSKTIDLTDLTNTEPKEPENPASTDPTEAKQFEKITTPEPKQNETTTTVLSDPEQPLEKDSSEPKPLENSTTEPSTGTIKVELNTTVNSKTIDLPNTEDTEPENPSSTDATEAKQPEETTTPEPKHTENTTTVLSDPKQPLEKDSSEPKPLENSTTEPSESTPTINLSKPTKKKRKPKRIGYKKRSRNPFHCKNTSTNGDALETTVNTTTNSLKNAEIIVEIPDNDLKEDLKQNQVIKEEESGTINATDQVDVTNASIKPESIIEQPEKVVTTSVDSKVPDQSDADLEEPSALRKLLQDGEIEEDAPLLAMRKSKNDSDQLQLNIEDGEIEEDTPLAMRKSKKPRVKNDSDQFNIKNGKIEEATPLAMRKSKKYFVKNGSDQFQFNIQDGGFTELHTIWLNEERSIALFPNQKYEMWNRRHDYWLLAGITVHGYCDRKSDKNDCQYDYITKDPRFAIINEPFLKGQGINISQQVKHQFLFRRQKLLEQALVIEEQLRRAANVNILKNPDDPVTSINAKIAQAKSIAELQLKNAPSRISREVFHQMIAKLDALLTEVKEDAVRLPAGIARGLPVAKQLENSERSILSRFSKETRSVVPDLAKFPRGFTECLSSYTNAAVNFNDFQPQYQTPAECNASSVQSQEVIDLSDDDASAA